MLNEEQMLFRSQRVVDESDGEQVLLPWHRNYQIFACSNPGRSIFTSKEKIPYYKVESHEYHSLG